MHSEWKVSSQYIGEDKIFQVYRLRDTSKVDHSGNMEYAGEATENQMAALAVAAGLNRREKKETPGVATPRESR